MATASAFSFCEEVTAWAALRCHSPQTLTLADSLSERGLCGWSSRLLVRRRLPRQRKVEQRVIAALPSFVFVPFTEVEPALDLGVTGTVPRSWPFLFNGVRPQLAAVQLAGLRQIEARRPSQRQQLATYRAGDRARLIYEPLHGEQATIVRSRGRQRWLVEVNGVTLSVPAFLLQDYTQRA